MPDPFDLQRFVTAQQPVYPRVVAELTVGRKRSHWMWFVFPQLKGLGASSIARAFGIASLAEARAYLAHPVLGARLRECAQLLARVAENDARAVMGYPDDLKLRSCLTLFAEAEGGQSVFDRALRQYFGGQPDHATLELLSRPR